MLAIQLASSIYWCLRIAVNRMATDWLGSVVSINCGVTLGVYQGEVSSVDHASQTISLRQPYHNGIRCPLPEVTFSAMDIKALKFLDIQNTVNKPSSDQEAAPEPSFIPSGRHGPSNRVTHPHVTSSSSHASTAPITILRRVSTGSSNSRGGTQATQRKNNVWNGGARELMRPKDDECFRGGTDENMDTDFDFEGNLALFDKAAVFSQIDGTTCNRAKPHSNQGEHKPLSYRHDENILEVKPVIYRQITVPQHGGKEYCTDSGLVVPSVPHELHKRLLAAAERWGLSLERRLETIGVCSSQMALTLLGGPNRGPLWSSCVGHTSREPRASAVVDTWPTTKWRSSCSCPILSRCRSRSPARSTSTAEPRASKWPASKTCQQALLIWSSTAWVATRTQC
ncbi:enhancer of mRNA-decapping protein 3 isoform X3 [Perca flavescens]|uniref:enhancer of mRNA-decapping protein 3 isoform X3 n=1 Tax=Perca flavescens TaxID=8167 RepID=UPI00106E49DD|nr:enhancer of mRNA-decapping protein 3 isoform X3 [Perca flavescens]